MSAGNWDRTHFVLYEKYFISKLLIEFDKEKKFKIHNVGITVWPYKENPSQFHMVQNLFFFKLKIKTSIDSVEEIFKTWNNPLADTETH